MRIGIANCAGGIALGELLAFLAAVDVVFGSTILFKMAGFVDDGPGFGVGARDFGIPKGS
jgi:hypothetical protein